MSSIRGIPFRPGCRRWLACALLAAASALASAQDWGSFAAASGRADDPAILQALAEGDLSERTAICRGIGERNDPYAADIIGWLLGRNVGAEKAQVEILLRVLLQGLFDPARGPERLRSAAAENAGALGSMISRIDRWTDPQLKSPLVRVLPSLPAGDALPALLVVGSGLVDLLRSGEGLLSPGHTGLALDYLSAVESTKCTDALEQCAAIARLSRDKVLVERARAVAKGLTR